MNKRGKITPSNPSPSSCTRQNERNASRTRSPRGRSPSGRMFRWPCKDYLKGTCNNSFCEGWHPPECLYYKTKSGCRFGEKCSYAHRQVDEQPSRRSNKNDDKSAVAMLKQSDWHENVRELIVNHVKGHDRSGRPDKKRDHELKRGSSQRRSSDTRQLCCVFQDMKPPKSILRKSSNMQRPIQSVKFTKAIARHTKIRDPNPSLGYTCPGEPHKRSPNAPKFEDRSQEETEWQEQGAREAAWRLAKNVLKLKEHERAAFFSPSENRCHLASTLKPMDASEIYSKKTQCDRGDISPRKGDFIFPIADGRIKIFGGYQDLRTFILVRNRPIQGESHLDFLGESEGSLPQPQDSLPDAGDAINDFWSMSGNFIYRHHVEPRVKLYSPREESFPVPLKYIDVSRTTHTNLDAKQEKRIDDYWNIDGSRDLSDPWTGFTHFTLLDENPPDGDNKKTAYVQARSSMARALEINGNACQAEGKAEVV